MADARSILHVDMDAFFASVEVLDEPSLRGLPVLVGGTSGRGVVSAASYEARVFGCRSAMPMGQALRLCPHAIVRPVRFHRYREVSRQVFAIFERYTPAIEGLSIDEAFLDLTGSERLLGDASGVARRIKDDIRGETGCTASVGVSYCKFLAKLASDLQKPDGLTVFGEREVESILPTLPVTRIWGVGPKAAARLAGYAIHTIGDLRKADPAFLLARFGVDVHRLIELAHGRDERKVVTDREAKSIGNENTFFENLESKSAVLHELLDEMEHVAQRLRRAGKKARTVTVKIRTADFKTVSRSTTLQTATDVTAELWEAAQGCFQAWAERQFAPVRLIGVQVKDLVEPVGAQMQLFDLPGREKQARVDGATDRIRDKFGKDAIKRLGP
jgi:DNA polymerase-4